MDSVDAITEKAKTGIWGLDDILSRGFTRGHLFLAPGTGKTTIALQFLLEGARAGERYFEALGTVRRAMSIIKKRTGAHEATIREFRIGNRGLTIGNPLDGFQGVLRGVPIYVGEGQPLLEEQLP
jgi:KaiC